MRLMAAISLLALASLGWIGASVVSAMRPVLAVLER